MEKWYIIPILIVIFSIAVPFLIFGASDVFEDERSYSIPSADIDMYVQENGSLHVVENLHYSFSGTFRGINRDIPLKSSESIENLNVTTQGAYSTFTDYESDGEKQIVAYLYSDEDHNSPVTDRDVDVKIEYDFVNAVNLYDDGATLHYTLWGDGWDVNLGQLNAYIHLNNKTDVKYWFNPYFWVSGEKWDGNTLEVHTNELKPGNLFEIRMVLPSSYFESYDGLPVHSGDGVAAFESLQEEFDSGLEFYNNLYTLLNILMIVLCFVPFVLYFAFGREPKTSYKGIYEREPPTNDSPAIVNAIHDSSVGYVDTKGFKATILDLIDRGLLSFDKSNDLENEDSSNSLFSGNSKKDNISITWDNDLDTSSMSDSEELAFETLKTFANKGERKISLDNFGYKVQGSTNGLGTYLESTIDTESQRKKLAAKAEKYRNKYDTWTKSVSAELDKDKKLEKLFVNKGWPYLWKFGVFSILLGIISFILAIFEMLPYYFLDSASYISYFSVALVIIYIIAFLLPNYVLGQWTVKGKEEHDKWKNFKKYLKDFSLIKEYPPSSIAIWNKYLVYGTALGVADKVQKSMEKMIPKEELSSNDTYIFYASGGGALISSFDHASSVGSSDSSGSSSGGGGNYGGGSGGGGGGAF